MTVHILCMLLLPLVFSRSMVRPTPQQVNGVPFLAHGDNFQCAKRIFFIKTCVLVMSRVETAEQGGYHFICALPMVLKIVKKSCGINAVIAQKCISMICFPWLGKLPTCRQHVSLTAKGWHFWLTSPCLGNTKPILTQYFLCRGLPTFTQFVF
jgi:hypothetical protein